MKRVYQVGKGKSKSRGIALREVAIPLPVAEEQMGASRWGSEPDNSHFRISSVFAAEMIRDQEIELIVVRERRSISHCSGGGVSLIAA